MRSLSCHPNVRRISGQAVSFVICIGLATIGPGAARAESDEDANAVQAASESDLLAADVAVNDSTAALPGLHRVGNAEFTNTWAAISFGGGYGRNGAILDENDTHSRVIGSLAVSLRPRSWLGVSVRLDQRSDFHNTDLINDSNTTVEGRLLVRAVRALTDTLTIGGELRLWLPGSAPDFLPKISAITPDAVLMASFKPLSALTISANLGYRLDFSHNAVDATMLSEVDRLDLGVSDYSSALFGIGASYRLGRAEVFGEYSLDFMPGTGIGTSPNRFAVGGRYRVHPSVQLQFLVETTISDRAQIAGSGDLIPIEPGFRGLASVTFQRSSKRGLPRLLGERDPDRATVTGTVRNQDGEPLADAQVSVTALGDGAGQTADFTTDADGQFVALNVPRGSLQVSVQAEGYKEANESVDSSAGDVDDLEIGMLPVPKMGQLRGVIQSFRGRPIKGTRIRVEPVGRNVVPDKGFFEIDLEPGEYTVIIRAPGYRSQEVKAVVTPNSVKILNVDLRRKRKGRRR